MNTDVVLQYLTACREAVFTGRPGGNVYSIRDGRNTGYAPATINRRMAAISASQVPASGTRARQLGLWTANFRMRVEPVLGAGLPSPLGWASLHPHTGVLGGGGQSIVSSIGLYIPETLLRHPGIEARAQATVDAWRRLGHEALRLSQPPAWEGSSGGSLLREHWKSDAAVAELAFEQISAGELDHVVARLLLPTPAWVKVAGTGRLALEVHNPLWRPETVRDVPRVALGGPTAMRLFRNTTAGFFVTRQLLQRHEYRSIPAKLALGNGIQLTEPVPAPGNSRTRIGMSVGSDAKWHGVDRFATWAEKLPQFEFVIIAPDALAQQLRRRKDLEALTVVGTPGDQGYAAALAALDAAVGSMAYDRWNLTEGAPMKVRDYVNTGIPTILTYRDTNLVGAADPAILSMSDWRAVGVLAEWLEGVTGCRVAAESRTAVSIEHIERNRLSLLSP